MFPHTGILCPFCGMITYDQNHFMNAHPYEHNQMNSSFARSTGVSMLPQSSYLMPFGNSSAYPQQPQQSFSFIAPNVGPLTVPPTSQMHQIPMMNFSNPQPVFVYVPVPTTRTTTTGSLTATTTSTSSSDNPNREERTARDSLATTSTTRSSQLTEEQENERVRKIVETVISSKENIKKEKEFNTPKKRYSFDNSSQREQRGRGRGSFRGGRIGRPNHPNSRFYEKRQTHRRNSSLNSSAKTTTPSSSTPPPKWGEKKNEDEYWRDLDPSETWRSDANSSSQINPSSNYFPSSNVETLTSGLSSVSRSLETPLAPLPSHETFNQPPLGNTPQLSETNVSGPPIQSQPGVDQIPDPTSPGVDLEGEESGEESEGEKREKTIHPVIPTLTLEAEFTPEVDRDEYFFQVMSVRETLGDRFWDPHFKPLGIQIEVKLHILVERDTFNLYILGIRSQWKARWVHLFFRMNLFTVADFRPLTLPYQLKKDWERTRRTKVEIWREVTGGRHVKAPFRRRPSKLQLMQNTRKWSSPRLPPIEQIRQYLQTMFVVPTDDGSFSGYLVLEPNGFIAQNAEVWIDESRGGSKYLMETKPIIERTDPLIAGLFEYDN